MGVGRSELHGVKKQANSKAKSPWAGNFLAVGVVAAFLACSMVLLARSKEQERNVDEIVRACAGEFGLDPRLVTAVIRAESGGRVDAVSPAGARGLMQIMPGTAQRVAADLELPAPSKTDLLDPEVNIRLGACYLGQLRRTFGDDWLALAAYNAGPGNVRKWVARCPGKTGAAVVRSAGFAETKAYVSRVMREWKG